MRFRTGLLVACFVSAACSQQGANSADLGGSTPEDLAQAGDLGLPGDQGAPPDQGPAGPAVSLVAGMLGGAGNLDGVGPAARFNIPSALAADGAGNLYVADSGANTIRRIALNGFAVTTLAGGGRQSGSTDGTGTAARFNTPSGLALDGAGNLYVADTTNHTIRKIVLGTGAVSTFAGTAGAIGATDGTGAAARFNSPAGLVLDGAGNLFAADAGNRKIRKIVLSTGAVSTFAGAGTNGSADGTGTAAQFSQPAGLATDGTNLYAADTASHTIRKIVLATAAVTTLAGTAGMSGTTDATGPAARFSGPAELVADRAGSLYVTDQSNHTVRKIVLATGAVTTVVGAAGAEGRADGTGTAARFSYPAGLALDGAGNLFLADYFNFVIRKIVLATGAVTTPAGAWEKPGSSDGVGAAAQFSQPASVVADGTGSLYVADTRNQVIRKIVAATGQVSVFAGSPGARGSADGTTAARFSEPMGLALDGAGNLYVTDNGAHTVRKIVLATGQVSTLAGRTGTAGALDGTGTAASFKNPVGLAADSSGNLFVADTGNLTIRQIVLATAAVTTLAGTAGLGGSQDGIGGLASFNAPTSLVADDQGNLYVTARRSHTIRKVVVATRQVTTLAGTADQAGSTDGTGAAARFEEPWGLTLDRAGGFLLVTESVNNTVRKIALANAAVSTVAGVPGAAGVRLGVLPGGFNGPQGVALGGAGEIFVVSSTEHSVLVIK